MSEGITFERFLNAVTGTNPFRSTRVTDPASRGDADVAQINQAAFAKLTKAVETVNREPLGTGLLLLGAAGVGKSHLLARLFQWADEDRATVVYLQNILASPERMYRYVLNATVSNLASHHGAFAESRLYGVITRALVREANRSGIKVGRTEDAASAMASLARRIDPSGSVASVMSTFRAAASSKAAADPEAHARARAAVLWLAGEAIDAEDARRLSLRDSEEELSLGDDTSVDLVLRVLANLCAEAQRPLVLCLDQVDNLDPAAVTALCAAMQALLDRAKHLLVVVSGVKETLLRLKLDGTIPQAAWDRIAERTVELSKISPAEAREIVVARLSPFLKSFQDLPQVRELQAADQLFPLGTEWLKDRLGETPEFRPRDIVTWARDRWEQQQTLLEEIGGESWSSGWTKARPVARVQPELHALIDDEVRRKLKEGVNRRRLAPADLPPDEDNLANLTETLLRHCAGNSRYTLTKLTRNKPGRKPLVYQLQAVEQRSDGVDVLSGVTFVTSTSGHVWRALGRVADDLAPPQHRILVTDEERRPIKLTSAAEREYARLSALPHGEFVHIKLSFESYAELDAMSGILGASRSGDLEVEYPRGEARRVSEDEALEALHRLGAFLSHPLLRELLTEESGPTSLVPPPSNPFDEERARQCIMAELSWRLGLMSREIAQTFAAREKLGDMTMDSVWARLKETARRLHEEGHIYAAAQDDDLFLQLRRKSA